MRNTSIANFVGYTTKDEIATNNEQRNPYICRKVGGVGIYKSP
jgi:hypothetical protein